MIRSTDFDNTYMLVDKQHYIVRIAYELEKIVNFLHSKNSSDYAMIVKHFDIDKLGMTVKEYDRQWNVLNEGSLKLTEEDFELLDLQRDHMRNYLAVLTMRAEKVGIDLEGEK